MKNCCRILGCHSSNTCHDFRTSWPLPSVISLAKLSNCNIFLTTANVMERVDWQEKVCARLAVQGWLCLLGSRLSTLITAIFLADAEISHAEILGEGVHTVFLSNFKHSSLHSSFLSLLVNSAMSTEFPVSMSCIRIARSVVVSL